MTDDKKVVRLDRRYGFHLSAEALLGPQLLADMHAAEHGGEALRRLLIQRQGPTVAGWLAYQHRQIIRRHGGFVLRCENKDGTPARLPVWARYGIECFRLRTKWWAVHEGTSKEGLPLWAIEWKGWHRYGTGHVERRKSEQEERRVQRNRRKQHLRLVKR
jgi:hypothetical protein